VALLPTYNYEERRNKISRYWEKVSGVSGRESAKCLVKKHSGSKVQQSYIAAQVNAVREKDNDVDCSVVFSDLIIRSASVRMSQS